jgi:hypothetical protein
VGSTDYPQVTALNDPVKWHQKDLMAFVMALTKTTQKIINSFKCLRLKFGSSRDTNNRHLNQHKPLFLQRIFVAYVRIKSLTEAPTVPIDFVKQTNAYPSPFSCKFLQPAGM